MPITSVRDNENNTWKRNAENKINNKDRKEQIETKARVNRWELNSFVVRLG